MQEKNLSTPFRSGALDSWLYVNDRLAAGGGLMEGRREAEACGRMIRAAAGLAGDRPFRVRWWRVLGR